MMLIDAGLPGATRVLVNEVSTLQCHLEANLSDISISCCVMCLTFSSSGEVLQLGKVCQLPARASRRCQEVQGGHRRGFPYFGPGSQEEADIWANCPLLTQGFLSHSYWVACSHGPGRHNHIDVYILMYHSLQPICALEHPKLKELIDLASHAKNGVKIPGHKATQGEMKHLFKDHITKLKA